jgi:hypothetical protein
LAPVLKPLVVHDFYVHKRVRAEAGADFAWHAEAQQK